MSILLVGLNHRTAPIELREQLALSERSLAHALAELPVHPTVFNGDPALGLRDAAPALREGVILSTCNRLEVYAIAREIGGGRAAVENFLSRLHRIPPGLLRPHLYFMHDQDAAVHLLRVAAGLDSMVLGEPQILGQVSQAVESARAAGTTGPVLTQLFAQAAHAGKRARAETVISQHTTSVSHAGARLAERELGGLAGVNALIVGAGKMAKVAALALKARGAERIAVINRTFASAERLASQVGGRAIEWHGLTGALAWADLVLSATSAPYTVINTSDVTAALPERGRRPLLLVDIAVPRDVEQAVADLPDVRLFDIDDLQTMLDDNLARREAAIPRVEAIVQEEAAAFARWISSRDVVPVIAGLRAWATQVARSEVERALNRLDDVTPREREVVELLAHRIVGKLLHAPTVKLRDQAARGSGYTYSHVVRDLFDLADADQRPPGAGESGPNGGEHSSRIGEVQKGISRG